MNKRISLLLSLPLLLLCLLLSSCNGSGDNSPDHYEPNGPAGNSSFDTTGMPVLSHAPGVYHDAILLELTTSDPSHTIHYTTDCTLPSTSSPVCKDGIPMAFDAETADATGVCVFNVRAAAYDKEGKLVGRVVSGSYLFPEHSDRFTTQVISMVTDPENLYKEGYGIISEPYGRGREWERPVNFQLFDVDGALQIRQDLGMRINGTGSRGNAQKNFRLFARKDYTAETGHLNYALFPGLRASHTGAQIDEFDTFLVRGGASNFGNSMITNPVAYEMMKDTTVTTGAFEPAALYLNGEYYGLMMLIEDYGPYFFESHYGTDENKITTLNYTVLVDGSGLGWELDDCTDLEAAEWSRARHFVEDNDMTDPENYARACEIFDMHNFIEYLVFNCYVNNWDWPRNNVRAWRYNGVALENSLTGKTGGYDPDAAIGLDGRWRFTVKDLDVSMGMNVSPERDFWSRPDVNFFDVLYKDGRVSSASTMFSALIRNESFQKEFVLCICEYLSTRCSTEALLEIINTLSLQVAQEMKYHSERYDHPLKDWDRHLQSMRSFAAVRPAIVLENVNADTFVSCGETHAVPFSYKIVPFSLTVGQGGTAHFNRTSYTEGEHAAYAIKTLDLPMTIECQPGYRLDSVKVVGGSYDENDGTIYFRSENATVTVTFSPIPDYEPAPAPAPHLVMNEIGHSSQEKVNGYDWVELYNPTDHDIHLDDWSITNGMETYSFPSITVKAGGFKVIFLSNDDQGGVYASFSLSSGDTLAIYDRGGKLVDQVVVTTKESSTHLGRFPDGGEWVELSRFSITPSAPNRFLTAFEHTYHDVCRDTVMINGFLMNRAHFSKNEQGVLTVSRSKVEADDSIDADLKKSFLASLPEGGDAEAVSLADWLAQNSGKKTITVYYVPTLGSYICYML